MGRAYFLACPAPGTPHAGRRPVLRSDAGSAPYPDLVLVVLDLVGIFVFAITGALVAVRKDLDVFARRDPGWRGGGKHGEEGTGEETD